MTSGQGRIQRVRTLFSHQNSLFGLFYYGFYLPLNFPRAKFVIGPDPQLINHTETAVSFLGHPKLIGIIFG